MKQPKRLSRKLKEIACKNKMNPDNWMLLTETADTYVFISKIGKRQRIIEKMPQGRQSKRGK